MKTRKSIKVVSIILAVIMLMAVSLGCKKQDNTQSQSGTSASKATAAATSAKKSEASTTKNTATTTNKNDNDVKDSGSSNTSGSSSLKGNDVAASDSQASTDSGIHTGDENTSNNEIAEEAKIDLNGATIKFMVQKEEHIPKADHVNIWYAAMYKNAKLVEDKYNCKIEFWWNNMATTGSEFKKNYLAGLYYSDVIYLYNGDLPTIVQNDMLYALDDFYDYTQGPLNVAPSEDVLFYGKHFGVPYKPLPEGDIWCYNVDLVEREGLPDPFELQQKGQWTWEALLNVVNGVTKDLNGDGIVDQWGIYSQSASQLYFSLCTSNGGDFINFNNGKYVLNFDDIRVMQSVALLGDLVQVYRVVNIHSDVWNNVFVNGQAAIFTRYWSQKLSPGLKVTNILPPKGPAVDDYICQGNIAGSYTIPKNIENPEIIAKILYEIGVVWDEKNPNYVPAERAHDDWVNDYGWSEDSITTWKEMWTHTRFPIWRKYSTLKNPLLEMFADVVDKGTPPATAMERVRGKMEDAIAQMNAR